MMKIKLIETFSRQDTKTQMKD